MYASHKSIAELPAHPFLEALDEAQNARMLEHAELYSLEPGEPLFRAGDAAARFFILTKGQIKLHRISPDGHEKIIELMSAPATFAEAVMFMEPRRYPVGCEALTRSKMVGLSMETFLDIIGESHGTTLRLLRNLSQKLHARVEDIDALSSHNAVLRVVVYLLGLVPQDARGQITIELPFSKKSVAARLSLQPETLSRTFARLKGKRLIDVSRKTIVIENVEALRELALTGNPERD